MVKIPGIRSHATRLTLVLAVVGSQATDLNPLDQVVRNAFAESHDGRSVDEVKGASGSFHQASQPELVPHSHGVLAKEVDL